MSDTMDVQTIVHIPSFVEAEERSLLMAELQSLPWERHSYFKRKIYHYRGQSLMLNKLILHVCEMFHREIRGAFLNYYEDGKDYAPYHSDKYQCDSCLVSLGVARTLRYKHNETKENTDYELGDGDLLFIPDQVNTHYKHSLLKRTNLQGQRISILIFFE